MDLYTIPSAWVPTISVHHGRERYDFDPFGLHLWNHPLKGVQRFRMGMTDGNGFPMGQGMLNQFFEIPVNRLLVQTMVEEDISF